MRDNQLKVSVCVPAYNEEKNIRKVLRSLLTQRTKEVSIDKIVVISSGSNDNTDTIVKDMQVKNKSIELIKEKVRRGKASAINLFLDRYECDVVVLTSADIILTKRTVENLCKEFIHNAKLGLTGGSPYPTNKRDNFVGYIVHIWWWLHRNIPRYGEIVAFRSIIKKIPENTAVDEAYIQAWFEKGGYKLKIARHAVVFNKGAATISDLIKQRRRIANGHERLKEQIGYTVDSYSKKAIFKMARKRGDLKPKEMLWVCGGVFIEIFARILGLYDMKIKNHNPFIWDQAKSTKKV